MVRHWSTITRVAALAMLLVMPLTYAGAQRIESRFPQPARARELSPSVRDTSEARTAARVAGGVLGGAVGMVVGAVAGYHLERSAEGYCYDWCGLTGGLFGAVLGEALGFGAGSHIAAPPKRSLGQQLLTATAIGGAGLTLAFASNSLVPMLFVVPVQIFSLAL